MNEETGEMTAPASSGRGVLEGAFALLEVLADGGEFGLTRLAADAGLPKATTYRLLNQLVAEGAVLRRSGRYQLGPRVYRLGHTWQPARLLRAAAAEPLKQLTQLVDRGGFSLSVPDRGEVMLVGGIGREIDQIFPLRAGTLLPPGTAAEQVLFAEAAGSATPQGFSHREWRLMTSSTRDKGLAYDTDLSRFGLACVAAPVHSPRGEVIAALAATVLEHRQIPLAAESIRRAAALISANYARRIGTHRAAAQQPVRAG